MTANFEEEKPSQKNSIGGKQTKEGFARADSNQVEENRRELLKYYSSQTLARTGYLITTAIGFFTLLYYRENIFIFSNTASGNALFAVALSLFTVFGMYLIFRVLYWSCLSHLIIITKLSEYPKEYTPMFALQIAVWKSMPNIKNKGKVDYKYRAVFYLNKYWFFVLALSWLGIFFVTLYYLHLA